MRLEVNVVKFVCEKCDREMNKNDTYCYNCGNDLTKEISYEEISNPKVIQSRNDYSGMQGCL